MNKNTDKEKSKRRKYQVKAEASLRKVALDIVKLEVMLLC